MVPMPSAESFQTLTRVWLDACERVAGSDHYRHDVPVIELFEAEKDRMLPLPGVRFDPCDWRSVKADKTGSVVIDANRYLAGPKWRSMRLQAGVRVFEIELRDPDGGHIVTLERVWGKSARTQVDPSSLLAIIARKPRIWGESPIRNDFPGPCGPCSTAWTDACGPTCSTTSAPWPPNAGSPPPSKRWRPPSTPDGPSTGPQSPHAPDASSRARAPRAARI